MVGIQSNEVHNDFFLIYCFLLAQSFSRVGLALDSLYSKDDLGLLILLTRLSRSKITGLCLHTGSVWCWSTAWGFRATTNCSVSEPSCYGSHAYVSIYSFSLSPHLLPQTITLHLLLPGTPISFSSSFFYNVYLFSPSSLLL